MAIWSAQLIFVPIWRRATAFALAFVSIWLGAHVTAVAQDRLEPVDLELLLLADASASIDDGEILFQRGGHAAALKDPKLLKVLTGGPTGKTAVAYVEWGGVNSQDVVVDWMIIDSPEAAEAFGEALMAAPRRAHGRNSIGAALVKGAQMLEENGYDGERRVIDFAGDSANSWGGPTIAEGRAYVLSLGVTINGLAILCRQCGGRPVTYDLEAAFERDIVGGPGAFVITADSRETFADAVLRKLLREATAEALPHAPSQLDPAAPQFSASSSATCVEGESAPAFSRIC